jgi:hypothetical protein
MTVLIGQEWVKIHLLHKEHPSHGMVQYGLLQEVEVTLWRAPLTVYIGSDLTNLYSQHPVSELPGTEKFG